MSEKPSLTLRRRINAPPVLVYRAWTDPVMMVRWWGPTGAETQSAEADPRPGGRYHVVFSTPDGESHDVSGTYRDADPHSLLAFTWMWRTLPDRTSFVTLTFVDDGKGGTDFTLLHEQFYDEAARDRHRGGWTGAIDKLEAMFA
ncbi:MAG: SRPBCC domain-containing protein [Mesorhizobium sp.]|nr:SRPBCC domain-containing protein [Mesorhizobium sp.]